MSEWKLVALLGFAVFLEVGGVEANRYAAKYERVGYERGVYQAMVVRECTGHYPGEAFKNDTWNLSNLPDDCRFVKAVEEKLGGGKPGIDTPDNSGGVLIWKAMKLSPDGPVYCHQDAWYWPPRKDGLCYAEDYPVDIRGDTGESAPK